ncbi:MAG: HD domain-containing protein [Myxococcales bacterium]|nr:HD domain-containing protein [Myxococcales bacterium]
MVTASAQLAPDFLDRLAARARARVGLDAAHDWSHVARVAANADRLARSEGADRVLTVAAALCHELFNYPKGHPESHRSGERCGLEALALLTDMGCDAAFSAAVAEAIRTHPFSLGETPKTLEGKLLQDADRLDAIGAIGVARCFATTQAMGRPFYNPDDPFCEARDPDDKAWGLDHFYKKLLRLGPSLHSAAARQEAAHRTAYLLEFIEQLRREITA